MLTVHCSIYTHAIELCTENNVEHREPKKAEVGSSRPKGKASRGADEAIKTLAMSEEENQTAISFGGRVIEKFVVCSVGNARLSLVI